MAQNLNNPATAPHRDYGATASSSSTTAISNLPDVNYSGFSPTELMSLSEDIGHNINAVNFSWKQLEKIIKVIGTPKDQQSTRDKVHNIQVKTNYRIETTTKDLQRLTSVVRRGDKQQKLQLEKLTTDFRIVVEKYSEAQQRIAAAMKLTYTQSQVAQQQDDDGQGESDKAELVQRQRQLEAGLQFEQDMLLDRERQIKVIEADILDVNSIMRTVSGLLQAQGEQVDGIETSIENAATEVELGRDELAKASASRQSYRRKILILLAIAVIIGLIVTGIIVSKLTS